MMESRLLRNWQNNKVALNSILSYLEQLYQDSSERVRQTVIYSCGITVFKFAPVRKVGFELSWF